MAVSNPLFLRDLTDHVRGDVHLPGDAGWDDARQAWNLAVDQHPAAVVFPVDAADVAATVRFARETGLRVAAQGTGHNAAPMASLAQTILVRTNRMRGVTVDAEARRARVEAGALWMDVVSQVPEGLAALSGSSPDVGVVGYSLGGGISWMARRFGLQANQVLAAEVVDARGEIVRADDQSNPDLLWALRGGGGGFGIVTALEFALQEVPEITAGMLIWDLSEAERVLRAYNAWAPTAPDEITTSFRMMALPDVEEIPVPLRGRSVVIIDGAVTAAEEQAGAILEPLRALQPEMDLFVPMPASGLIHVHQDPDGPTPGVSDTAILGELDAAGVDALLAAAREQLGALLMVELRQLGGALARRPQRQGALPTLEGTYVLFAASLAMTEEMGRAGRAAARALVAAMKPWHTGRHYLNFAENPADARTFYADAEYARLQVARRAADPDGIFQANHEIR